jgi:hypothetical protein
LKYYYKRRYTLRWRWLWPWNYWLVSCWLYLKKYWFASWPVITTFERSCWKSED